MLWQSHLERPIMPICHKSTTKSPTHYHNRPFFLLPASFFISSITSLAKISAGAHSRTTTRSAPAICNLIVTLSTDFLKNFQFGWICNPPAREGHWGAVPPRGLQIPPLSPGGLQIRQNRWGEARRIAPHYSLLIIHSLAAYSLSVMLMIAFTSSTSILPSLFKSALPG